MSCTAPIGLSVVVCILSYRRQQNTHLKIGTNRLYGFGGHREQQRDTYLLFYIYSYNFETNSKNETSSVFFSNSVKYSFRTVIIEISLVFSFSREFK